MQYDFGEFRDLAFFSWQVPVYGFKWDDESVPPKRIVHGIEEKISQKEYVSSPLLVENPETIIEMSYFPFEDCPTLFLQFADTETTLDGIIAFANKFGKLWTNHGFLLNVEEIIFMPSVEISSKEEQYKLIFPTSKEKKYSYIIGEPFSYWATEIKLMKNATRLWGWLQNEEVGKLSQVINWYDNGGGFNVALGELDNIKLFRKLPKEEQRFCFDYDISFRDYNRTNSKHIMESTKPGEILLPARIALIDIINKKLEQSPVHHRILLDEKNEPKQYVVPDNLLSAMWFQFYQSLTGEKKYKRCAVCQLWENVTEKRTDWLYHNSCGNTFRVRKSRGIRDILKNKKSIEEVASHCGVSPKLVREWLELEKKGD
ncbi:hypothetical protein ACFFHM_18955 [Halalkalibacter kiskunsagensis]|uniref:Uncharacterized protein n=1 Tax=Halalkalibacter kiskunsagensis TaxID=1548599 RepID=A0ABV6KHQ8_9BACI